MVRLRFAEGHGRRSTTQPRGANIHNRLRDRLALRRHCRQWKSCNRGRHKFQLYIVWRRERVGETPREETPIKRGRVTPKSGTNNCTHVIVVRALSLTRGPSLDMGIFFAHVLLLTKKQGTEDTDERQDTKRTRTQEQEYQAKRDGISGLTHTTEAYLKIETTSKNCGGDKRIHKLFLQMRSHSREKQNTTCSNT